MDILMLYWNDALKDNGLFRGRHADQPSAEETRAFRRSLRRKPRGWALPRLQVRAAAPAAAERP